MTLLAASASGNGGMAMASSTAAQHTGNTLANCLPPCQGLPRTVWFWTRSAHRAIVLVLATDKRMKCVSHIHCQVEQNRPLEIQILITYETCLTKM